MSDLFPADSVPAPAPDLFALRGLDAHLAREGVQRLGSGMLVDIGLKAG